MPVCGLRGHAIHRDAPFQRTSEKASSFAGPRQRAVQQAGLDDSLSVRRGTLRQAGSVNREALLDAPQKMMQPWRKIEVRKISVLIRLDRRIISRSNPQTILV
jgi:hypothetical protein